MVSILNKEEYNLITFLLYKRHLKKKFNLEINYLVKFQLDLYA